LVYGKFQKATCAVVYNGMRLQRVDFAVLSLFVVVAVLCVVVYFLPAALQDAWRARTDDFDPLTFVSSVFVHQDAEHLVSNVVVFLFFGCVLFWLNKEANAVRFLLSSLLLITVLLPLIYGVVFWVISISYFRWEIASYGLSLVVAGCIGLMVPSLGNFLKTDLQNKLGRALFFLGLMMLTGSVMIFSYVSSLHFWVFLLLITVVGLLLFLEAFRRILQSLKQNTTRQILRRTVLASLTLYAYFFCLALLFPPSILTPQGGIVNIFAHYFGVFFGMLLGVSTLATKE
jgi:membrane associated rhomboid family serine protease